MSKTAADRAATIAALKDKADGLRKLRTPEAEAEAEAIYVKIATLRTRYSIDDEMVRAAAKSRGQQTAEPTKERLLLDASWGRAYLKARCYLASNIGAAFGLATRLASNGAYVIYIGFEEDIKAAWEMFQLIERQMVAAADRRIKAGEHKALYDHTTTTGHVSARSFKNSYFDGYTGRIFMRLSEARREAAEDVVIAEGREVEGGKVEGRVTGALVLASRQELVRKAEEKFYPAPVTKTGAPRKPRKSDFWSGPKASIYASEARQHGRRDANKAQINRRTPIGA